MWDCKASVQDATVHRMSASVKLRWSGRGWLWSPCSPHIHPIYCMSRHADAKACTAPRSHWGGQICFHEVMVTVIDVEESFYCITSLCICVYMNSVLGSCGKNPVFLSVCIGSNASVLCWAQSLLGFDH